MRVLMLLVVAMLLSGAAAPAVAEPLEDALAAYEKGDYATALRVVRPLARQGNARAKHSLGLMYYNGHGVPQDDAAAAAWFRKAADQGLALAEYSLGLRYDFGLGVPRDSAAAVSWYRKAAEQGYGKAQFALGSMYENGRGVPQDYVQEHMWWNLSAARGDASAAKNRDRVAASVICAGVIFALHGLLRL